MAYQSHDDVKGASASSEKLNRLGLPRSLAGMRVLDLGCNEGFFCAEAKRRGAARVVGVDRNRRVIEAARERAAAAGGEIEFVAGDMRQVPDGEFDLVLLLSALHYVEDPLPLFRRIHGLLAPGGMLVLECGVANGPGRTVHRALRSIDDRLFPTAELLVDVWLHDFAVRFVARSVSQGGDPTPRSVFHCRRRVTSVALVAAVGGAGKTVLAGRMRADAVIHCDDLLAPKVNPGKAFRPPAQDRYDAERARHGGSIRRAWDALKAEEEMRRFAVETIVRAIRICGPVPLIVAEGYVLLGLEDAVTAALGPGFRCWVTRPGAAPED